MAESDLSNRLQQALDFHRKGDLDKAIAVYDEMLAANPDHGVALLNKGVAMRRLGLAASAMLSYWRGLASQPDNQKFCHNAVNALIDLSRYDEARAILETALHSAPQSAGLWSGLANVLEWQTHDKAAEFCFYRALALAPGNVEIRLGLAALLMKMGKSVEALEAFERARQLAPDNPGASCGVGQALISLGRLDEAEAPLRRAVALNADTVDAHLGLARLFLLTGNFAAGWPEYEWRRRKFAGKYPRVSGPEWQGEDVSGKTLLIYGDQGFGDTLQFIRYAKLLADKGARVIVVCPLPVLALVQGVAGVAHAQASWTNLPRYDFHAPLLTLPLRLGTTAENIPATVPYLTAPRDRKTLIVPAGTRLKVGLVWAGNAEHQRDRERSLPLETILPLVGIAGASFYSLQTGPRANDLKNFAHPALVQDLSPHLRSFTDTAGAIAQLDLIITADTAVAHLAGGLGKPVWVLIQSAPDWRWQMKREDSPWYPSMRLFRQRLEEEWSEVVARTAAALQTLVIATEPISAPAIKEAETLFQQGATAHRAGKKREAISLYAKAALLDSTNAPLYNNIGVLLRDMGCTVAATASYQRSLALVPDNAGALSNLGNVLRERGLLVEAADAHRRAMVLQPDTPDFIYNAALVERDVGRPAQSLPLLDRALALDPGNKEWLWDRALALLQQGDYAAGFPAYEARWGLQRARPRRNNLPLWDGSDLKGRSIFLSDEQGFGDVLEFARFIPLVKERGAGRIVVECQPELQRLLALMPAVDEVVIRGATTAVCNVALPLLSLPAVLVITLKTLPSSVPYLTAPPSIVKLPSDDRRKIGLVWAGKTTPRDRSCPLDLILPLLSDPQFALYSLQMGPRTADLKTLGADAFVTDLSPLLNDFAATASFLCQLDALITVDTAIAHLAGALGVKTALLLLYSSDWRWFDRGTTSPWYPSLTLFRQNTPNHWDKALAALRTYLDH
jgi:tetratricopeptide (TPR) repeat protein